MSVANNGTEVACFVTIDVARIDHMQMLWVTADDSRHETIIWGTQAPKVRKRHRTTGWGMG